jgi:hypothetical protein
LLGDRANPNGCRLPLTWFTDTVPETHCPAVRARHTLGDEIATHTKTHAWLFPEFEQHVEEIAGARRWLVEACGVPEGEVAGFRAPYLISNPQIRKVGAP